MTEPWGVKFVADGADGHPHEHAVDLPDETTARQFVALCAAVSVVRAAHARPLDTPAG